MPLQKPYLYFILSFALAACQIGEKTPAETETIASNLSVSGPAEVRLFSLDRSVFQYEINCSGVVESLGDQIISTASGGLLERLPVQTGKRVAAGSLLASFNAKPVELKLERARLQVFNAQKEYESQLLGYEKLLEKSGSKEKQDIQEKLRISSGLAGALQDIKEAEYELQQSELKAPFSGIIANVKVRQGEMVKPGTELFRIYQPDQLVLAARVLETDVGLLRANIPAMVFPVGAAQGLRATLYDINPLVDETGQVTVRLKLQLPRGKTQVFVGMHARATIGVPTVNTLVVPREALVYRGGKAVVFSAENGLAKWNYVTIGRSSNESVEITEGLKAGQQIIVSNNLQLAHDAPVKAVAKEDTETPGRP